MDDHLQLPRATFALEERVFVHGLVSDRGRGFNLKAARVVEPVAGDDSERVGVELLDRAGNLESRSAKRPRLCLKPSNLLRASVPEDRRQVLLEQVVSERQELVVLRRFLDERLPAGCGRIDEAAGTADMVFTQASSPLLFRIAEFLAEAREFPHQFSGFKSQIWSEHWRYDGTGAADALAGPSFVAGKGYAPLPRIDCAEAKLSGDRVGLVLFAGGCGRHPRLCRPDDFYRSAVLYDSLLDEWLPLPDMPTRRHGCAGVYLGEKVYVLGGQYVHDPEDDEVPPPEGPRWCDIFDLHTQQWTCQGLGSKEPALLEMLEHVAFFAAGVVGGRIIAMLPLSGRRLRAQGPAADPAAAVAVAFNPAREADGWRVIECPDGSDAQVRAGNSSCATEFQDELIIASGRPTAFARSAAAFRFVGDTSDAIWHHGTWRQLPDLCHARVGGALVVVEGRLYANGGCDEATGDFRADFERLDEHADPPCWSTVPWLEMPRALHAHDCHALPTLARPRLHLGERSAAPPADCAADHAGSTVPAGERSGTPAANHAGSTAPAPSSPDPQCSLQ